ncbi:MAG TPA: hypothetical protein VHG32_27800 [Thermoanaerobaculia bacterium]|nr:hypothetical protein [Thermoanaerobaculia bacterium]
MKPLHLSLAVFLASALLAGSALAQSESRLDPQPAPPSTGPPPIPLPPFSPPTGKAGLTGVPVPLPDPPARRGNPSLYSSWTYPMPMPFYIYPTDRTDGLWVRLDGMSAHDMHGGIPAPAVEYKVILRDGVVLPARAAPQLAGDTVRFATPRGLLVSLRASEVDLQATAAANALDWHARRPPAASKPPRAAPPR